MATTPPPKKENTPPPPAKSPPPPPPKKDPPFSKVPPLGKGSPEKITVPTGGSYVGGGSGGGEGGTYVDPTGQIISAGRGSTVGSSSPSTSGYYPGDLAKGERAYPTGEGSVVLARGYDPTASAQKVQMQADLFKRQYESQVRQVQQVMNYRQAPSQRQYTAEIQRQPVNNFMQQYEYPYGQYQRVAVSELKPKYDMNNIFVSPTDIENINQFTDYKQIKLSSYPRIQKTEYTPDETAKILEARDLLDLNYINKKNLNPFGTLGYATFQQGAKNKIVVFDNPKASFNDFIRPSNTNILQHELVHIMGGGEVAAYIRQWNPFNPNFSAKEVNKMIEKASKYKEVTPQYLNTQEGFSGRYESKEKNSLLDSNNLNSVNTLLSQSKNNAEQDYIRLNSNSGSSIWIPKNIQVIKEPVKGVIVPKESFFQPQIEAVKELASPVLAPYRIVKELKQVERGGYQTREGLITARRAVISKYSGDLINLGIIGALGAIGTLGVTGKGLATVAGGAFYGNQAIGVIQNPSAKGVTQLVILGALPKATQGAAQIGKGLKSGFERLAFSESAGYPVKGTPFISRPEWMPQYEPKPIRTESGRVVGYDLTALKQGQQQFSPIFSAPRPKNVLITESGIPISNVPRLPTTQSKQAALNSFLPKQEVIIKTFKAPVVRLTPLDYVKFQSKQGKIFFDFDSSMPKNIGGLFIPEMITSNNKYLPPRIYINPNLPLAKQQISTAHELIHYKTPKSILEAKAIIPENLAIRYFQNKLPKSERSIQDIFSPLSDAQRIAISKGRYVSYRSQPAEILSFSGQKIATKIGFKADLGNIGIVTKSNVFRGEKLEIPKLQGAKPTKATNLLQFGIKKPISEPVLKIVRKQLPSRPIYDSKSIIESTARSSAPQASLLINKPTPKAEVQAKPIKQTSSKSLMDIFNPSKTKYSFIDVGFEQKGKLPVAPTVGMPLIYIPKVEQNITSIPKAKRDISTVPLIDTLPKIDTTPKIRTSQIPDIKPVITPTTKPIIITELTPKITPVITPIITPIIIPKIKTPNPPPPPPPPPTFIKFPESKEIKKQKKKLKRIKKKLPRIFTQVRRKGKFRNIAISANLSAADFIGRQNVKSNLGASYRLIEEGRGVISLRPTSPEFYQSKRERGVIIQKRSTRLSSFGEKKEIQRARKTKWFR